MDELVSVIVPCYKNFDHIEDTLISIFKQDYGNIEIIISDDGSYNFEEEIKSITSILNKKSANVSNVIINSLPSNVGTVKNCNFALKLATGAYVKMLPPGDSLYSSTVLSDCVRALKNQSDTILIGRTFCKNIIGENTGEYKDSILYRYRARYFRKSLIVPTIRDVKVLKRMSERKRKNLLKSRCIISTVSVFFPMKVLRDSNGFLEEYRLLEDMPYWPYLVEKGIHFKFTEIIMVLYSLGGISNSGAKNTDFYNEYKKVMNEIYIKNDIRFGIFNKLYKKLRRKEVDWPEIKLNDKRLMAKIKNLDVCLVSFYRHIKYLLFNTKL